MAELDEGSVIGNYRVIRPLGQGGMGTVYEVEHLELGTHYALKTFTFDPDSDANHALKTKFLEEGKLLARLKHPNLTHVFDLGFEDGTQMPYFVMDLVTYEDGESYTVEDIELKDIDEDMVYRWFKQLASALDYIHGEGIVHRDIKPSNLLVDKDLNVVLTDFGISRIFGQKIMSEVEATRTVVTKTGRGKLVLGTEHYIAPEVADGEEATPKSDAYSLGVMLIRWLTGFYYGDNPGAIALLSRKKYRWLNVIPRLVAPAARRPDNYTELLKQVKPGKPTKPAAAPEPTPAGAGKKPGRLFAGVVAAVAGVMAMVIVGGVGFFGWGIWRQSEESKREQQAQIDAIRRQVEEKAAREKAEREQLAAEQARKEAEEKRIAEEKRKAREAKLAEQKRIDESRTKIEKLDPGKHAARETPVTEIKKETPEPEKPKAEFVVVKGEDAEDAKDYGPIPDRKYEWLKNGNAASPQPVMFEMANGAKIDLVPQKAGVFFMTCDGWHDKAYHKVTLTRPFWISRFCVTTAQWREFDEREVAECERIEKLLDEAHPLSKKEPRQRIDMFCEYMSKRYRTQLPKGYVFRLPTEAELEYAFDLEETRKKYGDVWRNLHPHGEVARDNLRKLLGNADLKNLFDRTDLAHGWDTTRTLFIGGLSKPYSCGLYDIADAVTLDTCLPGERIYSDEETDPLFWVEQNRRDDETRCISRWQWLNRSTHKYPYASEIFHIVVGPDLVKERAWETCRKARQTAEMKVPKQIFEFNPEKVPAKISKPKIVKLKMACGEDMEFCTVPKTKFYMSNLSGQAKTAHKVVLTKPYWITRYCITARQWREFAKYDCEGDCRVVERLFPKSPICPQFRKPQWDAFCKYLNDKYASVLPKGYVFRLPTEAEWEWAFVADKNLDAGKMDHLKFDPVHGENKNAFRALLQKKKLPRDMRFGDDGCTGYGSYGFGVFVGGRLAQNNFGVFDMNCPGVARVFDEYDADGCSRKDGSWDDHWGDPNWPLKYINYGGEEVDPVHWDGLRNFRLLGRWFGERKLLNSWDPFYAHIVIAPELDVEKRVREEELAPYPHEAFGGELLSDCIKVTDISSRHPEPWRNSAERWSWLVSDKPVIYPERKEDRDLRGCHTEKEDSPWVQLSLESATAITGIQVDVFRFHRWHEHLRIWASSDGKVWREIAKDDAVRMRYKFDLRGKNINAKLIRVGRERGFRNEYFAVNKILIYGKK